MKNKKRKFKGRELNATFTFNKKVAKSFHNTDYYKSQSDFNKSIVDIDDAKRAMATSNQAVVNEIFAKYIEKAKNEEINSFRVITNIRDKVIRHIQEGKELPKHDDLLSLVSNKYVLLQAYKNTRGNKGVLSQGYPMPRGEMEKLNAEQKILAEKLYELPDGLNWKQIEWISDLVKTGKYPWGYSKLIFIPKPGTTKMRPLTIPPYADRMVQEAIRIVLEPIYEPVFRKMNVSFGFHSGVGVHNAITLTSEGRKTNGLTYAIEGDIEQAYPSLDRDKLVEILSHRIKDIKFLKFIRKRLNLKLFNTETKKYENTTRGIPQGGVDSPYLWNIYLLGMDQQVIKLCQEIAEKHNNKRLINIGRGSNKNKILNPPVNKDHNKINRLIIKNKKNIGNIYNSGDPEDVKKAKIHHIQRQTKQFLHIRRNIPFTDQNRKEVRFFYARYADDFIILTNAPKDGRLELKTSLTKWLKEELSLTLSDEKTKLTDISKESAHFLGFELMNKNTRRISRDKNGVLKRTAGWQITFTTHVATNT